MDWQAMVFLGAYHGINPGMGWLFAVALGIAARQRARCVACTTADPGRSCPLGRCCARDRRTGADRRAARRAQRPRRGDVDLDGLYRLWRHGHPRFGGMQVGFS